MQSPRSSAADRGTQFPAPGGGQEPLTGAGAHEDGDLPGRWCRPDPVLTINCISQPGNPGVSHRGTLPARLRRARELGLWGRSVRSSVAGLPLSPLLVLMLSSSQSILLLDGLLHPDLLPIPHALSFHPGKVPGDRAGASSQPRADQDAQAPGKLCHVPGPQNIQVFFKKACFGGPLRSNR